MSRNYIIQMLENRLKSLMQQRSLILSQKSK